jgi:GlpG protein
MPRQEVQVMLVWFVVCFTGLVGQVANHAHAGGLVAGVLLGWIASRRR